MATLLIRLAGPMQSWGIGSVFEQRNTQYEPTKSGVLGLICAAFGRERHQPIDDLVSLRMGVRCDLPGKIQYEFQTALNVAKASTGTDTQLSKRAYLADANFLVGLEGNKDFLTCIHNALLNPVWCQFLGRKSYLPSLPVVTKENAIFDGSLEEALKQYPAPNLHNELVKFVFEHCAHHGAFQERRNDVPVSFEHEKREFTERMVTIDWGKIAYKEEQNVS